MLKWEYLVIGLVIGVGLSMLYYTSREKPLQYVGPYSPEAYKAAQMIKGGGNGAPYNLSIINSGRAILAAQR